jgi:hypothetical protein
MPPRKMRTQLNNAVFLLVSELVARAARRLHDNIDAMRLVRIFVVKRRNVIE